MVGTSALERPNPFVGGVPLMVGAWRCNLASMLLVSILGVLGSAR